MQENIQDIYPLSPMQQGMLFHSIYAPETEVYSEQLACKLVGAFNIEAFRKAWQKVVDRHDILRTAFLWEDLDEPLQVVQSDVELPFEILDWRNKTSEEQDKSIDAYMEKERRDGIDLDDAPLMRITMIQLADDAWYFIWSHHHILFDGWGLPIILKEVFAHYDEFDKGREPQNLPVYPYKEYIAWLQQQDLDRAKDFWEQRLAGFTAPTPFAVDKKDKNAPYGYGHDRHVFSDQLSAKVHTLAREQQLTINTLIQGAWALLLSRYSSEDDVLFGATVSGRPAEIAGIETMVGLFINTLPVRIAVPENQTILEWLKTIQLNQAELQQYEFSPLVEIQGWSDVPRGLPLFESILVFENFPVNESMADSASAIQMTDMRSFERTNFPLTLVSSPGKTVAIEAAYETNRFDPKTIQRMFEHLGNILQAFAEMPDQKLVSVNLLGDTEIRQTVTDWNKNEKPFPDQLTVSQWFENKVNEQPDATALFFEGQTLTYGELNAKANQLARHLQGRGAAADQIIAISLDRSPEMVVSLLAVLKAGAAYLPLDPDYPLERLHYMLADSRTGLLITSSNHQQNFKDEGVELVIIDEQESLISSESTENFPGAALPENLAYVIYTSGSTGKPKGVLLQHRGACNLVQNMIHDFHVDPSSRVLQFSSFSFDASFAEIMLALLSGAACYLTKREVILSKEDLIRFINENRITTATLPPSLLTLLPENEIQSFKDIISVGDACSWELAERWQKTCTFTNGYGPTETSVGCIWGKVSPKRTDSLTAPIGRPLNNVKIYLLDAHMNPVPVGVPGEIYIGGRGLARGYLFRPAQTAERFVPDPFSGLQGARLYRSGDLARYLDDGRIEFIGRVDFQVKLRGFRIELGEIEAALSRMPKIKDCVVLVRGEQAEKQLVAYLLPQDSQEPDISALRESLKNELPEYMVPGAFMVLDEFPLTPNGKVNRKALPVPDEADLSTGTKYVAPRTPEEELVANIWADVLQREKIGAMDNFFELGGHSLLATQVISRLRDAFDMDIPLRLLFETLTVERMASEIEILKRSTDRVDEPPITVVSRDQKLPLSFAQQRLWFLDQLQPGSWFNNIPAAIRLKGDLNIDVLEQCLTEMVRRHESLRTTFDSIEGKPHQIIREAQPLKLAVEDLSDLSEKDCESKIQELAEQDARSPFDLKNGPLFRAALLKIADDDFVVLFNMHHIISDGWSMGIFTGEIAALYTAFSNGGPSPLPELAIQYADYAAWQQNWLKDDVLETQLDFWKNHIGPNPPLLELPLDKPRPAVQTFNGQTISIDLPAELSRALQELSKEEGTTLFMTLLAAFQTLLHRYSGQDEILVGSPIANRTRSQTEALIGFFVNNIVLKSSFAENPSFGELLRQVRENTLSAYAHQDVPFEQIVDALQSERDMSHSPIFQVMFVMQNLPSGSFELPGLTMSALDEEAGSAKFDLSLVAMEAGEKIRLDFEYNTDLFEQATIERMQQHFINLLGTVSDDPELALDAVDYLGADEQQQLFTDWNRSDASYDSSLCVPEKFEQVVRQNPDGTAVVFNGQNLSYAQLDRKANQLAAYLRAQGIGPDDRIGICMERSPEMVIGIIGALKAGAAFVPLDPVYPADRLSFMIEDSALKILLTQSGLTQQLPEHPARTLCLDSEWETVNACPDAALPVISSNENLAYVIYTSGSTGRPKGTMLGHRGMINLANEQRKAFNIRPDSRILQFSSLSFDASVWETVMALLNGAALVLVDRQILASGDLLVKKIADEKITTITLPPSVLAVFPATNLPELETIITAGEKCPQTLVQTWGKGRSFFNAYGPTETTVCASMYRTNDPQDGDPPIGKAIGNFRLYILDANLRAVPVGVPGELCVAGAGLARGYLGRPDLTADRFIPDPFASEAGERLYRTGDLVRYLADGNIDFLGRIDHQVKVRGFRIELGEIESALREISTVRDTIVLAREDVPGEKRLAAYIVYDEADKPAPTELREHLQKLLPEYMIPSAFVLMDALPLTPNGKIDRKALPKPDSDRSMLQQEYVAPRNDTEEKLAAIVGELLHHEKVGIHDNFFALGGHSLLATQFMSRLRSTFDIELPLLVLFEKPTTAQIAEEITKAKAEGATVQAAPQIKRVSRSARRIKRSDLD